MVYDINYDGFSYPLYFDLEDPLTNFARYNLNTAYQILEESYRKNPGVVGALKDNELCLFVPGEDGLQIVRHDLAEQGKNFSFIGVPNQVKLSDFELKVLCRSFNGK